MKEPRADAETSNRPAAQPGGGLMAELRVSGHLMALDTGLFCIVQTPSKGADAATGLPGVRLSPSPGTAGRPERVRISGFHDDGWLSGSGDAALVRVSSGPAQILVTIYQARDAQEGTAPNLQVMRLLEPGAPAPGAEAGAPGAAAAPNRGSKVMEMMAHVQERGDVGAMLGDWLGERGSKRWIEGFGIAPGQGVAQKDIEYQAVLGKGWLSPWVEGGQFCGSRAMALPVLGLRVRLRGEALESHTLRYEATFVDGSEIGPVGDGEPCESESLAPLESFRIELTPRAQEVQAEEPAPRKPALRKPASPPPAPIAAPAAAPAASAKGKKPKR